MPRTASNPRIVNRTVRAKLPQRRDPYWHLIAEGQHLGYRKGVSGGTWIARIYDPAKGRRFESLGAADDTVEANGTHVLDFQQALAAATKWMNTITRADAAGVKIGPYTVRDAAEDWLKTQTNPTSRIHVKNNILPTLGDIPVIRLTKAKLYEWLQAQGSKPTIRSMSENSKIPCDMNDPETRRKRQDSANRVLRGLRALLNLARSNGHVESDAAWATLKEFDKVAKQRTEYLTVKEAQAFIQACPEDFRKLVQAALYTGCRYGELCALTVQSYDAQSRIVTVMQGKTRTPKVVYLTPDEAAFFEEQTKGKPLGALMFTRADGKAWGKDHQRERMKDACKAANIEQHITFHNLRHTFASLLAMNGTRPELIQLQMGHSSARMTARYSHFSPSYAASTIRANKPSFGSVAAPESSDSPTPAKSASGRKTGRVVSIAGATDRRVASA